MLVPGNKTRQADRVRFEFRIDGHWNGIGHQEVAEAIASSRLWQEIETE